MPDADELLIARDLSPVSRVSCPYFIHLICPQWIGVIRGLCIHSLIRKIPLQIMQKTSF